MPNLIILELSNFFLNIDGAKISDTGIIHLSKWKNNNLHKISLGSTLFVQLIIGLKIRV